MKDPRNEREAYLALATPAAAPSWARPSTHRRAARPGLLARLLGFFGVKK